MFNIRTYNKISQSGLDAFDATKYTISDSNESPDAIILRSQKLHDMSFNDELLAIGRAGAGTNNIPVDVCTENGVVVFNAPGANANAVKELVLAGMFITSRNIVLAIEYAKGLVGQGDAISQLVEKNKSTFKGAELRGKKLGVIGLGAIGMMVANAASSIGMKVVGYDPFISIRNAWQLSRAVQPAQSIKEVLATADYVSLHLPLTKETKHLINKSNIQEFKPGAVLLNFARDGIVNEDDVLRALSEGHLARYVNDFPSETLLANPKCLCFPHLGASTEEAEENCALMIADQVQSYLEDGNITNSVNYPNCTMQRSTTHRLAIAHDNIPNMVGQITKVLAENNLNIAEMVNKSRGELAYTLVDIDSEASEAAQAAIKGINGVGRLRVL